ncbi:hypothetical protein FDECE_6925 [Fusarium decemcellulare]|nr:hypothetical protein FDECE_6925 [Fusarium decemcellulare]
MLGHNWLDERGAEGVGYVRAVGTLFPKQLMEIMPDMERIVQESFDSFAEKHRSREGYLNLPAHEMHKTILSEDETFMKSIFKYNEIVINAAEVLRLVPGCLKWIIGPLVGRTQSVQTIVFDGIHRVVSCRLEAKRRAKAGECVAAPSNDMIQWIIDTAPKDLEWGPRRITYEIIAIWFGSVHALSASTTFALFDLCDHPEYIDPLRKEVEGSDFDVFMKTTKGLPLLDSFIKESARINPIESMAGRRQALKEFSFSDGTVLRKGDWACVPVKAIQSDDTYFPRPDDFFGFRFVPRDMLPNNTDTVSQPEGPSSYSDISDHYYSWGVGGIIW